MKETQLREGERVIVMKKDKGVAVSSPKSGDDTEKDSPLPTIRFSSRNASSKYDFVKVYFFVPLFFSFIFGGENYGIEVNFSYFFLHAEILCN